MGLHNPLPSSLESECKKCAKILSAFIDPRQSFGPDKVIPPSVLANAKGLAVLTVIKAGFLGSARFGSGLVVARLPGGGWSAPSAVATAGAGIGGQIGFELTDFVFILNDDAAVKTFAQAGSLTLGGNVSIAAGPVGRNAEAAGAASLRSVSGIFSYSKTKGLFAGVSLEGSAIIERRDANEKMYQKRHTAKDLLSGSVPTPREAAPLMTILGSRVFNSNIRPGSVDASVYNDMPTYDSSNPASPTSPGHSSFRPQSMGPPPPGGPAVGPHLGHVNTGKPSQIPMQPPASSSMKMNNNGGPSQKTVQAVALFTFESVEPGDLGFKKGQTITVTKRTTSDNDWWTGKIGDRSGIFPSNYVKVLD